MLLLSSADYFYKMDFFKKFFLKHYKSLKQLKYLKDQDRCFVSPDLGPNCLQTTTIAASKERVNTT